jgi:deferrochelatase/peroxidase EfeB
MYRYNKNKWIFLTQFLVLLVAGVLAVAGSSSSVHADPKVSPDPQSSWKIPQDPNKAEPFWGEHQSGIVTPPQHHIYFAVFDLVTNKRADVIKLLQAWTAAAARLSTGDTAQPLENGLSLAVPPAIPGAPAAGDGYSETSDPSAMAADTGETIGMSPARLTLTFGFGAGLFIKDGKDRYGLAAKRPEALVDMPKFPGDQLAPSRTGGDLCVQSCAEDPQVAFHAVRQLARIAEGVAVLRWVQIGYRPTTGERHLLGFSNGKGNPNPDDQVAMANSVWVGDEGPEWMHGGTYIVARRIRFAIEHWDHMPASFQEKAVGEPKYSPSNGAPKPGSKTDAQPADDQDDQPVTTHLKIVGPGAKTILRRSFSYNDGVDMTSERWPPWRHGLEYDAGMFFVCYQRDPRSGYIAMFTKMAKYDAVLNQFWTHVGSALFAYPPGAANGEYIGQRLFESK